MNKIIIHKGVKEDYSNHTLTYIGNGYNVKWYPSFQNIINRLIEIKIGQQKIANDYELKFWVYEINNNDLNLIATQNKYSEALSYYDSNPEERVMIYFME